jgi:hypothetical protein
LFGHLALKMSKDAIPEPLYHVEFPLSQDKLHTTLSTGVDNPNSLLSRGKFPLAWIEMWIKTRAVKGDKFPEESIS